MMDIVQNQPQNQPKPAQPAPLQSPSKWLSQGSYSDDIETKKLHVLVYGMPKSGKTTFLGTFPKPFMIDADRGRVTLAGKHIFGITPNTGEKTYNEIMELLRDIKAQRNGFEPGGPFGSVETVALDTITRLSELIKIDTMVNPMPTTNPKNMLGKLDPSKDKPEFDHWGLTKQRLGDIIDLMHELPLHTIVTAWVEITEDDSGAKLGLPKTEGKYREVMAGRFDEVYYSYAQSGTPVKYFIRTVPYSFYIAGSRLGMPPILENPSFEALMTALRAKKGPAA